MQNYRGRIEIKPGKFAYVQTEGARDAGLALVNLINRRWRTPSYCYHLKEGGHLAAIDQHAGNQYFARLDIENFFQSISKNKIIRALKRIRLSFFEARDAATLSTVRIDGRLSLPYGFAQSPLIATLVLAKTPIHRLIVELLRSGITITLYVDDFLLSANSLADLQNAFDHLQATLLASGFRVNTRKTLPPAAGTEAFNIAIGRNSREVVPRRLEEFRQAVLSNPGSVSARQSIQYVQQVNPAQGRVLAAVGAGFSGRAD